MKNTISLESLISRTLKFSRQQSRAPFTLLLGVVAAAALWAMPGTARGQIFVSDYTNGTVSEYNLDGTTAHAYEEESGIGNWGQCANLDTFSF